MRANDLETLANEIGARDIFVFHVLSEDRMVNLDGWGRGSGWVGNVYLDLVTETFLAEALDRGISRLGPGSPTRAFGPYWAEEAVAFRSNGHVVTFGGGGVSQLADDTIRETAQKAVDSMKNVRAIQRLAAELEIAQAELSVARSAATASNRPWKSSHTPRHGLSHASSVRYSSWEIARCLRWQTRAGAPQPLRTRSSRPSCR